MDYSEIKKGWAKRQKRVVHLRDVKKWTFTAIADEFGITRQRANQIYTQGLAARGDK